MTETEQQAADARRAETIARVSALYDRLSARDLAPGDLIDAASVTFTDQSGFLRRIHADAQEFETYFAAFADTYDVFRGFPADAVILDAGAHWGYSALAMRRRGAVARIFSVEAMPWNIPALAALRDVEAGRYDFIHCAATERPEELVFYVPVMNGVANTGSASTGGTLIPYFAHILADLAGRYPAAPGQPDRPQLVVERVAGLPIDEIARRQGFGDRIAAIKMDIEGHEAPALRGAREVIARNRPLLMIEGANSDPAVVAVMAEVGYAHFERHDGKLLRHDARSNANDGFWIHPSREADFRGMGLL